MAGHLWVNNGLACGHVDTVCVWRVASGGGRWRKPLANSILRSVSDSPVGLVQVRVTVLASVGEELGFI